MSDRPSAGIGLVDVLIGGMASVILLFFALTSRPAPKDGFGLSPASFKVSLDMNGHGTRPNLAVRFRLKGAILSPKDLRGEKGDRRLSLDRRTDGQTAYTVSFADRAKFTDDEVMLVYLHDLCGSPPAGPFPLKAERTLANGTTATWTATGAVAPLPQFDFDHPVLVVPLTAASGQASTQHVEWEGGVVGRPVVPPAPPPAVVVKPPDADPPQPTSRFAQTARHPAAGVAWRVEATWDVLPARKVVAHTPGQLSAVAVVFGSDQAEGLTVRFDAHFGSRDDRALARQALGFFWQPRYEWKAGAFDKRTKETRTTDSHTTERFQLVNEPEEDTRLLNPDGSDAVKVPVGTSPPADYYELLSRYETLVPPRLARAGSMSPFLDLLKRIGTSGRGSVYWLVEPGQPLERLIVAWVPTPKRPWREGPEAVWVASPVWPQAYPLEALEPPAAEVAGADGKRTGLVRLPVGSWDVLNKRVGVWPVPVALGVDGVAVEFGGAFEVSVLRAGRFAPPVRTAGLARAAPPEWTSRFDLTDFRPGACSPDDARHLVGLVVCSPAVWKELRSTGGRPVPARQPLFADPELWACPPAR